MSGDEFYEDAGDVKQRILGGDPRPTASELRRGAMDSVIEGVEPHRARTSNPCPECDYPIPSVEESGPDVGGLREAVRFVVDAYSGTFTEQELRELVADATAEVLDEEVDEGATAAAHVDLSEFEDDEEGPA